MIILRKVCVASLAFLASLATHSIAAEVHIPNIIKIDACSSDPLRLGVSRTVIINTQNGPQFGDPNDTSHGKTIDFLKDGEVILTFDDGPHGIYTIPILRALKTHCTKATFFMVGKMAAAYPAIVKEIATDGHTIGSHTLSHKNLKKINIMKGQQELENGISEVIKANGGPIAPFFRFPFLNNNNAVEEYAKTRNISTFWVDVDSKDYLTHNPTIVHKRIMAQLSRKHKGIILMHDVQPSTAKAIMGLLDALRDKGFKVVHMVPRALIATKTESFSQTK